MSFYVVVPARYASTRLPGKPLADIAGKPMVVRVAERCQQSEAGQVYVATDDSRIAAALDGQVPVVMTREDHPSGTDRLQEVAATLGLADDDIIVNVQGDEPLIPPSVINQVAANLAANPSCQMATLCEPIDDADSLFNPNVVKVVFDDQGRALYFSRAPIPWHLDGFAEGGRDIRDGQWWRHIGIYAYRVSFLHQYVQWPPAQLEQLESLEQLRAMANGVAIHVAPATEVVPGGVDTPADLERLRKQLGGQV
ncbi:MULTISPECIES: 3-deoxy-manno-octulosonate cytidylyltransferase [unclassified Alcanivorax]|jgi:3-deoxy-manno-octulosonate cytidylyltransferase (CMP-KDO synthetase)|uniref:3-deoxy-manno-octulosonate cytidylyltransferase n=1 Tax=unclassified Alcanivorax TaxID=2638842 RepID=UPI0008A08206|nr:MULTISPECIES: 3-deoxy-manno-octulosonate cytidylyltransferase [unclassified Alcanivorax]MEE3389076.1 3-deoxy-manno-octulosonate cytidylyltransferase [Pseudomonadota bacterium]SEF38716.1 3-deoxy-manno-octulosonate cytidylyltransferase (CMP-KDO synthetase) [Alcanivorax sp. DSM 26293]